MVIAFLAGCAGEQRVPIRAARPIPTPVTVTPTEVPLAGAEPEASLPLEVELERVQEEATKAALAREVSGRRWVHLATHGWYAPEFVRDTDDAAGTLSGRTELAERVRGMAPMLLCGLAMAGALIGVGGAYFLFTYGDVAKMTNGIFVMLEVTPKIMGIGAMVAALLGIVASVMPSIAVAKMSVVDGLKTLD